MRVGILCFWSVPNYGAWAQAYALNNAVRNLLPSCAKAEHIAYLHEAHFDSYYKNDEKLYRIFEYNYDCITHTRILNAKELAEEKFDIFITGSDAVWEFSIDSFGNDPFLIGNDINAEKLISYAASFGTMSPDDDFPNFVRTGLGRYSAISVRDDNSAEIVERIVGKKAEYVLDPTLIWDFTKDANVKETSYSSYIAVYGMNFSDDVVAGIKALAKKKGLRTISLGYINDWCDVNLRMVQLRGLEWIGMFKNAEYVLTNMFHGFMFGLNFNKQLFFCRTEYVKKRSETLLKELGIYDLYSGDDKVIDTVLSRPLDYTDINERLDKLRNISIDYLKRGLEL